MSLLGSKLFCKMPFDVVETFALLFWDLIPDWHVFYIQYISMFFCLNCNKKCHQTALWEKRKGPKFDPQLSFGFVADRMVGNSVCQMYWWPFLHTFSWWWMRFRRSFMAAVSGCKVTDSFYILVSIPALVSADMLSTAGQGSSKIEIVKTYILFSVSQLK